MRHCVAVPLGGGLAVWLSTVAVLGLGALVLELGPPPLPGVIARYVDGCGIVREKWPSSWAWRPQS